MQINDSDTAIHSNMLNDCFERMKENTNNNLTGLIKKLINAGAQLPKDSKHHEQLEQFKNKQFICNIE